MSTPLAWLPCSHKAHPRGSASLPAPHSTPPSPPHCHVIQTVLQVLQPRLGRSSHRSPSAMCSHPLAQTFNPIKPAGNAQQADTDNEAAVREFEATVSAGVFCRAPAFWFKSRAMLLPISSRRPSRLITNPPQLYVSYRAVARMRAFPLCSHSRR
jgi:hypothetical protein